MNIAIEVMGGIAGVLIVVCYFLNIRGKLKTIEEIEAVLNEIENYYKGYELERTPIELINYHEKCAV